MEQASACIADTGSVGKENTSGSKVELSVERQQMKKKKKGFNLRKSLAWDRAFSTEEGGLFSVYGFSFILLFWCMVLSCAIWCCARCFGFH